MSDWQPIETAPKDCDFLVFTAHGYITRGRFLNGRHFACDSHGKVGNMSDTKPTHWMPLPEPPK